MMGICMSISTRSQVSAANMSTASCPFVARLTSWPHFFNSVSASF